jgi:hypothetical protein
MDKVDTTLFTKKVGKDLFVLQIYVDDIIFGSTNQEFCEEFRKMIANEFEMSMIGELNTWSQIQANKKWYICESRQVHQRYAQEIWHGGCKGN